MRPAILLILTIILLSACNNSSNKESKDDAIIESVTIPENVIPIIYTGHIFVKGEVDSLKGNFIFDTGSNILLLDSIYFSYNDIKYNISDDDKISGIGNGYQKITAIDNSLNFWIGKKKYYTLYTPIVQLKQICGDFADGIIGTDFFSLKTVEINYENKYINIYNSIDSVDVSDYKIIPIEKINNFFCIPLTIKINEKSTIKGKFIIDTGCNVSIINSPVAKKNEFDEKINPKIRNYTKHGGLGGQSECFYFIADSLKISNFNFSDVNMCYSEDSAGLSASGEYSGILGNNILDRFDLLFDFKNCKLYLKPNESFDSPFTIYRLGFLYVDRCITKGGWIVTGIYENSAAERQGLKIDDKIISVNEIPVEKIPLETQKDFFKKLGKVKLVVKRADSLKNIEFELVPLL